MLLSLSFPILPAPFPTASLSLKSFCFFPASPIVSATGGGEPKPHPHHTTDRRPLPRQSPLPPSPAAADLSGHRCPAPFRHSPRQSPQAQNIEFGESAALMPNLSSASKTPISSSNRKSVFLHKWWLIEVKRDSKLGIGGFVNRETLDSRGMRLLGSPSVGKGYNLNTPENETQVFGSAAIAKRLDSNTLEAVDGITITISGCINRSRTLSNGFSAEVCDRFLSGFPCNWEEYKSSPDKFANTTEISLPTSFDDLPVTRVRDILLSTKGESEACGFTSIILRDILKQCSRESLNPNASSVESNTETEVYHKQDGVSLLNPTQKIIEESHKIHTFPVEENHKETEAVNLSPKSPVECFEPFSKLADPKPSDGCKTTRMSRNKRRTTEGRYPPRRSTRMKRH